MFKYAMSDCFSCYNGTLCRVSRACLFHIYYIRTVQQRMQSMETWGHGCLQTHSVQMHWGNSYAEIHKTDQRKYNTNISTIQTYVQYKHKYNTNISTIQT